MYVIYIMEVNVLVGQKRGMELYHYCDECFLCLMYIENLQRDDLI